MTIGDAELARQVEACRVPEGGFHHAQHVQLAWYYLQQFALPEALGRFITTLKRFAAAQGAPDRYHETITVASCC